MKSEMLASECVMADAHAENLIESFRVMSLMALPEFTGEREQERSGAVTGGAIFTSGYGCG